MVISIVTFGCEAWILTDKDIENLLSFQRFAGKRIQLFKQSSPNSCAYNGLGWSRLMICICVKKLLFIQTVAKMDKGNFLRSIFELRFTTFLENPDECKENAHRSPFYDIFNTCMRYGLLGEVITRLRSDSPIVSKKAWSDIVWGKAWMLEDTFWHPSPGVFAWLIGKSVTEVDFFEACAMWEISGNTINSIYKEVVKRREGIDKTLVIHPIIPGSL